MRETSQVILTVPRETKAEWVARSRQEGMKLTDWMIKKMEHGQNFDAFTLNIAAFLPFESYVLSLQDDDAKVLLEKVRRLDASQPDVIAPLKIVKSYLEKRVAIASGIADRDLFHDINVDAVGYFAIHSTLTHTDLMRALYT